MSDYLKLADLAVLLQATEKLLSGTGKFRRGDRVRKIKGSQWQGRVVGTYSTSLTPEGYAVESEAHAGSVQIYPAAALERVGGGDA